MRRPNIRNHPIRNNDRSDLHGSQIQPQSQYFIPAIQPGATATLRLPGGKYCLGSESTVPFVSFPGGGVGQKVFSWGETIEIPEGQMVSVKNESFHRGDIAINSLWDYANKPARITVPVPFRNILTRAIVTGSGNLPAATYEGAYPADARLAKRVYIAFGSLETTVTGVFDIAGVVGTNIKHSFPTEINAGVNYTSIAQLPSNTLVSPIGMGAGPLQFNNQGQPMALLDIAQFIITITANTTCANQAYYIIEY